MADVSNKTKQKHVSIVGGGLVGSLLACYMAKKHYKVDVFEMRSDIRTQEIVRGRSINMALSVRGVEALAAVGMVPEVAKNGIPMHARMIHDLDGTCRSIPYGKKDQYILSIDRRRLNEVLLTEAEKTANVTLYFDHKFITGDFDTGEFVMETKDGSHVHYKADLIIGSDGAFSAVRRQMMKTIRLNYQQEYISHGYMELMMPPTPDDQFAMGINYLHIWPRNEYMMIALPNQDKTYTVTIFMEFEKFEDIKTADNLMEFFKAKFPDSIPLLGEDYLKKMFVGGEAQPLLWVKCSPYHIKDKVVLVGDAAHAMVPFYGQGMNAGFEDCAILNDLLNKHNDNIGEALSEFTSYRSIDAFAICDLALNNYIEMRESVNSRLFLLRKKLDNFLHWFFPRSWVPLYTTVAFTRTRYHKCIMNRKWQDRVLTVSLSTLAVAMVVGGTVIVKHFTSKENTLFKIIPTELFHNMKDFAEKLVQ